MEKFKRQVKRITSIILIITILVSLLPNFGLLNISKASDDNFKGIILRKGTYTEGANVMGIELYLKNLKAKAIDITFLYPKDKVKPINYMLWNMVEKEMDCGKPNDMFGDGAFKVDGDIIMDSSSGSINMFLNSDAECNATNTEILIGTIYLKITDATINDITSEMFKLTDDIYSILQIVSTEAPDGKTFKDNNMYKVEGFPNPAEKPTVSGLEISGIADSYFVGDKLDLDSITVKKKYSDGTLDDTGVTLGSILTDSDYTITIGENALTTETTLSIGDVLGVTYNVEADKAEDYEDATVTLNVTEPEVTSIVIEGAPTSYKEGTEIDLSGVYVNAKYENNETKLLDEEDYTLTAETASGTSVSIVDGKITPTTAEDIIITATYKEDTTIKDTKTIEVVNKELTGLTATKGKTLYKQGEILNLSDLTVTAKWDTTPETELGDTIPLKTATTDGYTIEDVVDGDTLNTVGVKEITVKYGNQTATVELVVFPDKLVGIEEQNLSEIDIPESVIDFKWENGNLKLNAGKNNCNLQFTNEATTETLSIEVLGIPTNLTAKYGETLENVKYNGTTLPTGFAWEFPTTSVGDAGEQTHNITYAGYTGLTAKVNVAKKEITVTIGNTSSEYTGQEPTMPNVSSLVTIPAGAIVGSDDLGITLSKAVGTNVGKYAITGSATNTNYKVTFENEDGTSNKGTYEITRATLAPGDFDISIPENYTKEYDGNPVTVTSKIKDTVPGADDIRNSVIVEYYKKDGEKVTDTSDFGEYEVKVSVIEGNNYNEVKALKVGEFSVTKATLDIGEITVTDPNPNTYDGTPKIPTINIPDGAGTVKDVKYYKAGTDTEVTNPTDAGKYDVKITTENATNYADIITLTKIGTFEIEQAEIPVDHIIVTPDAEKTYNGKPSSATATLDATVPGAEDVTIDVTYVDVDENSVTDPKDAGTYTIKVSSNGGKNYKSLAETETTETIVINKVTLSETDIQCTLPENLVYNNTSKKATIAVVKDLGEGETLTVDAKDIEVIYKDKKGDTVTDPINAGTYTIDVSVFAGKNYEALTATGVATYTVEKATLTKNDFIVTGMPAAGSKEHDGEAVTITAPQKAHITETLATEIQYYESTDTEHALSSAPSGVGTYIVKLKVTEGTNYKEALINLGTFTINPQGFDNSKINYTNTSVYDNKTKTEADVNIQITDDESAVISNVKFYQNESKVDAKDVGTYTIRADIDSGVYGKMTDAVIGTFTITQREITVTIGNAQSSYGEEFNEATANITDGTLAAEDTIENVVEITKEEGTDVGTYDITGESINDNYDVTFENVGTYTINPMSIEVTIGNTGSVYGETEASLDDSLITLADGIVLPYGENISDLKITLTKEAGTDVGTYAITGESTNENYDITYVDGTYTITKATLKAGDFTSNIPTEGVTYGTTVDIEATYKNGITKEDAGEITVKYYKDETPVTDPTEVGTYVVKVSTPGGKNYYPADGSTDEEGNVFEEITLGEFSIVRSTEKPNITITAPTDNTYDGTPKTPTINIPDGAGSAKEIKYYKTGTDTEVTNPTDAGKYDVKITTENATNYADITTLTLVGTFEISPREIEVTIADKTSVYGDTLETLTSEVTDGELVEGDDLGITLSREEGTDVGDYAITGASTNTNYDVTFVDGTYTITARPVTISIDNKESAIKEGLKELTYEVTLGTKIGTDKVVELETDADVNAVGTYDITVKSTNNNYDVTMANTKGIYTVKDKVKEIILSENEITADCGTSLEDLINDITYQVVYVGAGAQPAVELDKNMITTAYNPNITASQTLTVTYTDNDTNSATNGDEFTADLTVTLSDALQSITVTTTDKNVNYYEGQTFNKEDMVVTANYAKAASRDVDNYEIYVIRDGAEVKITDGITLEKTDKEIIVKYTEDGITVSSEKIEIDVKEDEIVNITFTFNGTTTYEYGDPIDLGTSTITKVWASRIIHENDTIPMTKDMLVNTEITTAPSSFGGMKVLGTKSIGVQYGTIVAKNEDGTNNTFTITVNDIVTGIQIQNKENLQKEYDLNSSLNYNYENTTNPVKVTVTYASSGTEEVNLSECYLSGYSLTDKTKVGQTQTVTVTYNGKVDSFEVEVRDFIESIKVTKYKAIYDIGDSLNIQEVKAIMASGTENVITDYTATGFNSTTPGTVKVTVSYDGKTDEITVTIRNKVDDMYIEKLPSQISSDGISVDKTILLGTDLTKNGGTIIVKDAVNPEGKEISMTDPSVSLEGYNKNLPGTQTITVRYTYEEITDEGETVNKSKTATFNVEVEDYVTGYKVTPPTKTTYEYGEDLKLDGATVSKVWKSGKTTDTIEISGDMVSEYNSKQTGAQTITVDAFSKEKVGSFTVTVVDSTLDISMKELPSKTEYTQGEPIDVSGAVLNVTKSSGTKEIAITKEMISGYDPNKVGTQVITVTYDGKQTEFVINVKEAPKKPNTPTKPTTPTNPVNPTKPSTAEVEKYTVTFIDYDGEVLKTEEVEAGKSATAPEVEERPGYKFTGWNRDFDAVEEDLIIMAKYEEVIRAEVNAPDNMKVEQGEDIDLSEVTLVIFDEDGNEIDEIPVTEDMISGFNSEKIGTQVVTVTYVDEDGVEYTATFKVKVVRPAEVLGVKDEVTTEENNSKGIIIPAAIGVGAIGLLLALIGLATRKNVQIYAVTEDERKLIGKEKLTKHDRRIVLDEYEKKLKDANIEIVLNKKITRKLDEEMIDIVFRGKKSTYKVKDMYNQEFTIKMKNI